MRTEEVFDFLNKTKASFGDAADRVLEYTAFENFYDRKLWHQLTVQLLNYVVRPEVIQNGDELQNLYTFFIADFTEKINQTSLVQISLAIVKSVPDLARGQAFLETISTKVKASPAAYALVQAEVAQFQLSLGQTDQCKKTLEEVEKLIDSLPGVDQLLHSTFYQVSANFDKVKGNYNSYYKNALLYLACTPIELIPLREQQVRAQDIGIAALLGDSIYNFGELLAHPILKSLVETPAEWLYELLFAFNSGDVNKYDQLLPHVEAQKDLAASRDLLQKKLSLMGLIEMLFKRQAGERVVPLAQIAQQVRLPHDQVEYLLMRALSLGLIKGTIDEVEGVIDVTWVTPRVLDRSQVKSLASRLVEWTSTVSKTILHIQTQTPDLFVQ